MLWTIETPAATRDEPRPWSFAVDPYDDMLEEPLFLDGIAIRRWSDLARLPRPREASPDRTNRWTAPESDPVTPVP